MPVIRITSTLVLVLLALAQPSAAAPAPAEAQRLARAFDARIRGVPGADGRIERLDWEQRGEVYPAPRVAD